MIPAFPIFVFLAIVLLCLLTVFVAQAIAHEVRSQNLEGAARQEQVAIFRLQVQAENEINRLVHDALTKMLDETQEQERGFQL